MSQENLPLRFAAWCTGKAIGLDKQNVQGKIVNERSSLTKGSYGHFSSFCVIKISKTS